MNSDVKSLFHRVTFLFWRSKLLWVAGLIYWSYLTIPAMVQNGIFIYETKSLSIIGILISLSVITICMFFLYATVIVINVYFKIPLLIGTSLRKVEFDKNSLSITSQSSNQQLYLKDINKVLSKSNLVAIYLHGNVMPIVIHHNEVGEQMFNGMRDWLLKNSNDNNYTVLLSSNFIYVFIFLLVYTASIFAYQFSLWLN